MRARSLILLAAILLAAGVALLAETAAAAELLMYRRAGCAWCQAWDREVGPVYGKTQVGRRAPVRMIEIDGERPPVSLKAPIRYSPTFVLAEADREIGRIEGYPGENFFWGLIEPMVQRLPLAATSD